MNTRVKFFRIKSIGLSFSVCLLCIFSPFTQAADISFGVTSAELLGEACPDSNWENLKHTIDITMNSWTSTTSVPWKNAADNDSFRNYVVSYQFIRTLPDNSSEKLTNDALTVASQCIMRRNAIVDNQFNRNTDSIDNPQHVAVQALSLVLDRYLVNSSDRVLKSRHVDWVEEPKNLVPLTHEETSTVNLILREYLRMSK